MMFSKSVSAFSIVLLSVASQVLSHAVIEPAVGFDGKVVRDDSQRPSKNSPCGNVNIANAVKTATPVVANNGVFTVEVQNFNAGPDGSTEIKQSSIDATATGKNFTGQLTISKNGDPSPKQDVSTVNVTAKLPDNTTCSGGSGKNQCLVSFTTGAGFGNCVLVTQNGGGSGDDNNDNDNENTGTESGNNKGGNADVNSNDDDKGSENSSNSGNKKTSCNRKAAGTRKAREVLAREVSGVVLDGRDRSWLWAA